MSRSPMTVKEMISILSFHPPDTPVYVTFESVIRELYPHSILEEKLWNVPVIMIDAEAKPPERKAPA